MPFIRTSHAKGKPMRESYPSLDPRIDRVGERELVVT